MALEFRIERTVDLPRGHLWRGLTDLEAAHSWMPGLVTIERLTEGPLERGSRWRETRMVFKREATEEFEVREMEPPRRLALRVDGAKGSSRRGEYLFEYLLEETDSGAAGTQLTLDTEIRGMGLLGAIFGRLMAGTFRKAMEKDLDALIHYLRKTAAEPR